MRAFANQERLNLRSLAASFGTSRTGMIVADFSDAVPLGGVGFEFIRVIPTFENAVCNFSPVGTLRTSPWPGRTRRERRRGPKTIEYKGLVAAIGACSIGNPWMEFCGKRGRRALSPFSSHARDAQKFGFANFAVQLIY
jgi:hypothetical protein